MKSVYEYLTEKRVSSDSITNNKKACPEIFQAILDNDREKFKELLDNGCDVNIIGIANHTPLIRATSSGRSWMISKLIEHGADTEYAIDMSSLNRHITAFFIGLGQSSIDVETLEELSTGVPIEGDMYNRTPLGYLLSCQSNYDTLDKLKWLIKHGADINKQDSNGDTPMHLFLINNRQANTWTNNVFEYLLTLDIDPTIKNDSDKTILHIQGNDKYIQELSHKFKGE